MNNKEFEAWKNKIVHSAKEKRIPVCGQFELTPRCNFDCKMCYIHNQESNLLKNKELSTEQWKKIFDEAYDMGLMFVTLTGGECLLRDDFKELYLHLWRKRVFIIVFTNGYLINDEYVEFFKQYRPDRIQITLYGSSERAYKDVTCHTGFTRVIDNIKKLQSAGINVLVTMTPSRYSIDDYIDTIKYARSCGFHVSLGDLPLLSKRDEPSASDYFLTSDEIVRLTIEREKLIGELHPVSETPEPCGECKIAPKGLICNAGNGLAYITWEGKMCTCGNIMQETFSLLEMGYAEAWEKTKACADRFVRGVECVDCPYDAVCPKCPAIRLQDLHSGHCNPAVCEMTRKLVAAGVKKLDVPEQSHE